MKIDVKICKTIENAKALKAVASITFDDAFAVHNVKVIETVKGRFIAMPSEVFKDNEGNEIHRDICHPISSSARKELEDAVLCAYEEAINNKAE